MVSLLLNQITIFMLASVKFPSRNAFKKVAFSAICCFLWVAGQRQISIAERFSQADFISRLTK
jgi:hypothetical protein